jgi:hypothetical protein
MPVFTESQKLEIKIALGWTANAQLVDQKLAEQWPQPVINRAIALLNELTGELGIDAKLIATRSDSMATSVGQLQLSYAQHVAHLRSDGSRMLTELAHLLSMSVQYNRYSTRRSPSTRSYW